MCAVAVVIQRHHAAVQQVDPGGQRMPEIGVAEIDARIDDADLHMDAGRSGPGLRSTDGPDPPGHQGGTAFVRQGRVNLNPVVFFYTEGICITVHQPLCSGGGHEKARISVET